MALQAWMSAAATQSMMSSCQSAHECSLVCGWISAASCSALKGQTPVGRDHPQGRACILAPKTAPIPTHSLCVSIVVCIGVSHSCHSCTKRVVSPGDLLLLMCIFWEHWLMIGDQSQPAGLPHSSEADCTVLSRQPCGLQGRCKVTCWEHVAQLLFAAIFCDCCRNLSKLQSSSSLLQIAG